MILTRKSSIVELNADWDKHVISLYQERLFLEHLEKTNPCRQRYYSLSDDSGFKCGAVVYSLRVNLLTFSRRNLSVPMTIIGIPASVDASPLIGNDKYFSQLVNMILDQEKGVILCLNHDSPLDIRKINQMKTLPGMILQNSPGTWDRYMQMLRHPYRRRVIQAESRFAGVEHKKEDCNTFSREHYDLYLAIMKRTPTKLEVLELNFFKELPEIFHLHSYYADGVLLTWHITAIHRDTTYFLFGGINYQYRDRYDSYMNNLLWIIRESFEAGTSSINMGQTAEITKNRLGAEFFPKNMFLYHKNFLLNFLFRLSKGLLTYRTVSNQSKVFK